MTDFKKGDRVCHYELRQPLTIIQRKRNPQTGAIALLVEDGDKNQRWTDGSVLEHTPSVGDTVLIMPTPYIEWLTKAIARDPNEVSRKSRAIKELDPIRYSLPQWFIVPHTIDRISLLNGEMVAFFNYEQERKRSPLSALKVLQKFNAKTQEISA